MRGTDKCQISGGRVSEAGFSEAEWGIATSMIAKARTLLRSLNIKVINFHLKKIYGMDIDWTARISTKARLDKTNPTGVHIGARTAVTLGATVLAHDGSRKLHTDTWIGEDCFIGCGAIIMPGVRIGDQVIVAAGAVVTQDIPSHSVAAGNPAIVIKSGIRLEGGRLASRQWSRKPVGPLEKSPPQIFSPSAE